MSLLHRSGRDAALLTGEGHDGELRVDGLVLLCRQHTSCQTEGRALCCQQRLHYLKSGMSKQCKPHIVTM